MPIASSDEENEPVPQETRITNPLPPKIKEPKPEPEPEPGFDGTISGPYGIISGLDLATAMRYCSILNKQLPINSREELAIHFETIALLKQGKEAEARAMLEKNPSTSSNATNMRNHADPASEAKLTPLATTNHSMQLDSIASTKASEQKSSASPTPTPAEASDPTSTPDFRKR